MLKRIDNGTTKEVVKQVVNARGGRKIKRHADTVNLCGTTVPLKQLDICLAGKAGGYLLFSLL